MLAFVAYALIVWYGACRWRRSWQGFLCVVVGELGILLFIKLHTMANAWTSYDMHLPVLQFLLWGYLALIGSVGLFIACVPRRPAPWCCQKCDYDLAGVPGFTDHCPECGTAFDRATAEAAERRARSLADSPTRTPAQIAARSSMAAIFQRSALPTAARVRAGSAPDHAPQPAGGENQPR